MKTIILLCSCMMLVASGFMAWRQIKRKKPVTDLYLMVSVLTFLIALRMVGKVIGIS